VSQHHSPAEKGAAILELQRQRLLAKLQQLDHLLTKRPGSDPGAVKGRIGGWLGGYPAVGKNPSMCGYAEMRRDTPSVLRSFNGERSTWA
jgi:hypothetical protein